MKQIAKLAVAATIFISACGSSTPVDTAASSSDNEVAVDDAAALRSSLEGHVWVVQSLDRGFSTDTSIGKGKIRFHLEDDELPLSSFSISDSCSASGGTYIEWSNGSFTQVPNPPDGNTDLVIQGPDCNDPDDLIHRILNFGEGQPVAVSLEGDVLALSHKNFAITLAQQTETPSELPVDSTTITVDPTPTTAPD